MSIDALKDRLPEYAKDLKLNLSSLARETVLDDQKKWGAFLSMRLPPCCAPRPPDVQKHYISHSRVAAIARCCGHFFVLKTGGFIAEDCF